MDTRFFYAQINEENIAFSIVDTYAEINKSDFIRLEEYDESVLGKRWNNGIWEEVILPDPGPPVVV